MLCFRFTYVSVGANSRASDGGVFNNSLLAQALANKTLGVPEPALLPGTNKVLPYVLLADEAFPLKTYLMKPYPRSGLTHDQKVYLFDF